MYHKTGHFIGTLSGQSLD